MFQAALVMLVFSGSTAVDGADGLLPIVAAAPLAPSLLLLLATADAIAGSRRAAGISLNGCFTAARCRECRSRRRRLVTNPDQAQKPFPFRLAGVFVASASAASNPVNRLLSPVSAAC